MTRIHELFEIRTYMLGIGIVAACLKMGIDLWAFYGRTLCNAYNDLGLPLWNFWW